MQQVEKELLWSRILSRLQREPGRVKYNEDKREWMEATLSFYESFQWDFVRTRTPASKGAHTCSYTFSCYYYSFQAAENNHITLRQLRDGFIRSLGNRSPRFTVRGNRETKPTTTPPPHPPCFVFATNRRQ